MKYKMYILHIIVNYYINRKWSIFKSITLIHEKKLSYLKFNEKVKNDRKY